MTEKNFTRPDLTGETFGGVRLAKKIGSGGFGDVYISEDHKICVKFIFRESFDDPESYEKERDAVRCISSCIREHCGIVKLIGSLEINKNVSHTAPPHPRSGIRMEYSDRYRQYQVTADSMKEDCERWKEKTSREFFYYFMLAADNLAREPEYIPDTLENRCRRGLLEKMSDHEKIRVLAAITDALLFLYHLEVNGEYDSSRSRPASHGRGEILHVTHGDVKPANIFFVNGYAQLGDMGASLQVNPEELSLFGTPEFMLQGFPQQELKQKCGDDYFAYAVFSDVFALGKTAEYMMLNGDPEGIPPFSELSRLVDVLKSFHADRNVKPENVVKKLEEFRCNSIRMPNQFHDQSLYGTAAPEIRLRDLYEFSRIWQITEAESTNRFRVTNEASEWGRFSDVLLAERFPSHYGGFIRSYAARMMAKGQFDGCPILIFRLMRSKEIIILSHSKSPFTASEGAGCLLQNEIDATYRE